MNLMHFLRDHWKFACLALALVPIYGGIAWLVRGGEEWWYLDFVAGSNVYWGDDGYRFFLARSAWLNPDLYWFNFMLPLVAILDGLLVTLGGGDLFYSRALKSLPLVASLIMVYSTARHLGVRPRWSLVAAGVLGTTPVYVLVALSYYGEAWFVFFISLMMLLLASGRNRHAAFVAGLMPLVRIEGLAFVMSLCAVALWRRDWRTVLLALAPGTFYFLLIVTVGPGVPAFLGWREEAARVYDGIGIWYGGDLHRILDVLFWPWVVIAAQALSRTRARSVWPCAIGTVMILLQVTITAATARGSLEPRFLVMAFPTMAVGLALTLQALEQFGGRLRQVSSRLLMVMLIGMVVCSNILSVHVFGEFYRYVSSHWTLPPSVKDAPFRMETWFRKADAEKVSGYREYADVAMRMIELNPHIDTLVVSDAHVLYFLDPKRIPTTTEVVFALFGWSTLDPVLNGPVTFGYHPRPPFHGFYSLKPPKAGDRLLLYLDDIGLKDYPYHWVVQGNHIYLFSGERVNDVRIIPLVRH